MGQVSIRNKPLYTHCVDCIFTVKNGALITHKASKMFNLDLTTQ